MAANIDFDLAMNKLVTRLEEAGRLDDTLIVISSDHSPYYLQNYEVNSVSKLDRDNKFDRNRGSLIIYNSAYKGNKVVDKYAMNIDVLPTVLNMLNIPYDSRLIIGRDIMAPNTEGLVVFPDRSWVNNKGSYDTATSKFTPYVDSIDDKYITKITNEVNEKYNVSVSMQYNDYYKYVFK
jgi:arylsulfatase A-like enzyme